MSKFIRTKDKVYEVTNDKWGRNSVIEENGVFKIHCENMGHHWYSELEVINQADTIEELCDEFHIEFDSLWEPKELLYSKYYHFDIAKRNLEDNETLYGVIHIKGKGLIYVAKLNDKGDLELI